MAPEVTLSPLGKKIFNNLVADQVEMIADEFEQAYYTTAVNDEEDPFEAFIRVLRTRVESIRAGNVNPNTTAVASESAL